MKIIYYWPQMMGGLRLWVQNLTETQTRFFIFLAIVGVLTLLCLIFFFIYLKRTDREYEAKDKRRT